MVKEPDFSEAELEAAVDKALENWDDVIDDLEVTAAEYREAGWNTMEIHPLDLVPVADLEDSGKLGLELVVANNEFEEVKRELEEHDTDFDRYEAYTAERSGLLFMLLALQDTDREFCLIFPAYYDISIASRMIAEVKREGWIGLYIRRFMPEPVLTVPLEDPDEFLPRED